LFARLPGSGYLLQQLIDSAMENQTSVQHQGISMAFTTPNALCRYRAETFSIKEPETLDWLDSIPVGSVLWDVGANVGLYSIYAAKKNNARVFAFEPSVFNLELLARNVFLNDQSELVTIVPLALSDALGSSLFRMSTTAWGGALSTFGRDLDQHGGKHNSIFEYQMIGMAMDDAVSLLHIPPPNFIKVDVDGIEHFVLQGGGEY
jgi:FkbM family methyltransferase